MVAVMVVGLGAAAATIVATRDGPTVTPDGSDYLRMAHGRALLEHPPGHFPPGYPWVLSIVESFGLDPIAAGRWLGVVLACVNVCLAGAVALRMSGPRWAVVVAIAVAAATPIALLNAGLYSEPLFLTLLLVWLLAIRSTRRATLALAGVVAVAATLTRFAGVALLAAGVAVLWQHRAGLRAHAAGAGVPLALWGVLRLASSSSTGRSIAWHAPEGRVLLDGLEGMSTWTTGSRGSVAMGVLVTVCAAVLLIRARRLPGGAALGIAAAAYAAVLGVTLVLLDAQTPLDSRLLAPVQLLVILAIPAVATLPLRRWLAASLGAVIAVTAFATPRHLDRLNGGMLRLEHSPTVAAAAAADGPLVSNAPGALWVLTGRDAAWLPMLTDPHTLRPNAHYRREADGLRRQLASRGMFVWVAPYDYRTYLPTEAQTVRDLHLELVARYRDGAVYRAAR
jgi:hypothetical protein